MLDNYKNSSHAINVVSCVDSTYTLHISIHSDEKRKLKMLLSVYPTSRLHFTSLTFTSIVCKRVI